jgi:CYTH domain-containing protein
MDETTRLLLLALIEAAEETEKLLFAFAHRHRALLEVLAAKGAITRDEYEQALKEREAAHAVDAVFDEAAERRRRLIAQTKRLLEEPD